MVLPLLNPHWSGIPYVKQWTAYSSTGSTVSSFNVTKPTDHTIVNDDLLMILCATDDDNDSNRFNTLTGWTLEYNTGLGGAVDTEIAMYWRIADGTETATENVTATVANETVAWYLHWKDNHDTTPIIDTSLTFAYPATTNHSSYSITPTFDNCRALCLTGFSVGDAANGGIPTNIQNGWSLGNYQTSGTAGYDASAAWFTKEMPRAGPSDTCEFKTAKSTPGASRPIAVRPQ